MAYQSKHTGPAIDVGIDINDTQNSRMAALENEDIALQNNINSLNSTITNLQSQITSLQEQMVSLQSSLDLKVNKDQVFLGYGHTQIPANANLNNYLTGGTYCCSGTATAQTLTNCPVNEAFTMFVYNAVGGNYAEPPTSNTYRYIRQIVIPYSETQIYMRTIFYNNSTTPDYGSWVAV